jgi:hypothetical protein
MDAHPLPSSVQTLDNLANQVGLYKYVDACLSRTLRNSGTWGSPPSTPQHALDVQAVCVHRKGPYSD